MPTVPLLLAASLALQLPAKPFTCEAGGFRVDLPGTPKEQLQTIKLGDDPLVFHIFGVDQGGVSYGAAYSDYPQTMAAVDPDLALERGIEGAMKGTGGKLLVKRKVALNGHPGREFSLQTPGPFGKPGLYRSRIYLVGLRLYQVILNGAEEKVSGEAGEAVFNSFVLLKPPPPPEPLKPLAPGKPFASADGRFRVKFPSAPREVIQKVPSDIGPIEVHMAVVDRGDVAFFASYNDYGDAAGDLDPEVTLGLVIQGSMEKSKGTLRSKKDISLGKYPGKAYEATLPLLDGKPATCRGRIYLVDRRLYQVLVVEPKGKEDPKTADAFFDSFALIKAPTP